MLVRDGTVSSEKGVLTVSKVSEMTVLLAGATDFNVDAPYSPLRLNLRQTCTALLDAFETSGWAAEKAAKIEEHQEAFNRVHLRLGPEQPNGVPQAERVVTARTATNGVYDLMLEGAALPIWALPDPCGIAAGRATGQFIG